MGARTRYFASKHLTKTADSARNDCPQVACFAFDVISSSIMIDGRFEREELDGLARLVFAGMENKRTCLDIGANIGNHSLFFATYFQNVLAFEPHPRTFRLLELNAELADNIAPHQFGLSDKAARVSAAPIAGNIGMTSIGRASEGTQGAVEFDVVRLDDVPTVQATEAIDFIKIDVEGHELPALQGAKDTLRKHQPVIAMEVLENDIVDGTSAAIDFLTSLGYAHTYVLQSNRPFARAPKPVSRLRTALAGLIFDKRPAKDFTLAAIERLEARNHPIVLLSVTPL